jgi:hypothetical protein
MPASLTVPQAMMYGTGAMLGSDVAKGLTAPAPNAGTKEGASKLMRYLYPYLNNLMNGGNAPDIQNLLKAFDLQRGNLTNTMQKSAGQSGQYANALASSQGLQNPLQAMMRGRTSTMAQFAPEFGKMASSQATGQFQANRDMLNQTLQTYVSMIGLGGRN